MPAVTVDNPLVLPRIERPDPGSTTPRPVEKVVPAQHAVEGAGFEVWRPFPGVVDQYRADPFLLLDQMGPVYNEPKRAKGAPWHPHRGFETVTYLLDGELVHHDSHGGGGTIGEGGTQWMTAGSGLLHDELPSEHAYLHGGRAHGVQLWVNLPSSLKFATPRYQSIDAGDLTLLASHDGGALVRVIAGEIGPHAGPGSTHTPITYAHATVTPGAELIVPWNPQYNALVYVLSGQGFVGDDDRPVRDHDLALFGDGDSLRIRAADQQIAGADALDVLLLGGRPIGEPISSYGPFVMNTRAEIVTAVDDFQAGRLGTIPPEDVANPKAYR